MHAKYRLMIVTLMVLVSCSQDMETKIELSNPGFGITETSIKAMDEGIDLPVLLKTDDVIKGMQFTLSWDPSIGQVIQPTLTNTNPGFTLSAGVAGNGEMKILIFSMQGDVFNTGESTIMTIPVRIIDPDATIFSLTFKDAIFAGPGAVSYPIPVTHARLKINR